MFCPGSVSSFTHLRDRVCAVITWRCLNKPSLKGASLGFLYRVQGFVVPRLRFLSCAPDLSFALTPWFLVGNEGMRYPIYIYIYIYPLRDYIGYLIPSFPTKNQPVNGSLLFGSGMNS